MTIQVKRVPFLGWDIPLNARTLQIGETLTISRTYSEGDYIWRLKVLNPDTIKVTHVRPYHLTHNAEISSFNPENTSSIFREDEINSLGPANRNLRWVVGKER